MISFTLDIPPTVNHAYANARGRKVLTTIGRVYKRSVIDTVIQQIDDQPNGFWTLEEPMALDITLFFPSLENAGWSKGKSSMRYKQIDASNRVKLVEDGLSEALGVDDRHFFDVTVRKRVRADDMPPLGCCVVTLQPLTIGGDLGRASDGGHE